MRLFYNKKTGQFVLSDRNRVFPSFLCVKHSPDTPEFADLIIKRLGQIQNCACEEVKVPINVIEYVTMSGME